MHGVADETIVHGLSLRMWLMAFGAIGYQTVRIMTEGAGLLGMLAGIVFKFLSLLFMTGKAGTYKIVGKGQIKRFVRVRMAAQAIFQLEMGPSFVAVRASRNNVGSPWRVLFMTIETSHRGFMLSALTCHGSRLFLMTFYTIGNRKSRRLFSCRRKGECRRDNYGKYCRTE